MRTPLAMFGRSRLHMLVVLPALLSPTAHAQVVLDGSVGPGVPGSLMPTISGAFPNGEFAITDGLGTAVGGNLFHSFTQLDLTEGQGATFSGPASVVNILSRVTGGSASNIDGTLRVTIDGANLFLVNTAGVVFGPNARLDLTGAFIATTADVLPLADGGHFAVSTDPADSLLTSAHPHAFGFLGAGPGDISVTGSTLAVAPGQTLTIVSGPIQITAGQLEASGGGVNLVAVDSAGEVHLDPTDIDSPIDMQTITASADITAGPGTVINTDGNGGGRVLIRGNDLTMFGALVNARSFGTADGRATDIGLTGRLDMTASAVDTTTASPLARGGDINVAAQAVNIDGFGIETGAGLFAITAAAAEGGDISVESDTIDLLMGGSIFTVAAAAGRGGDIRLTAGAIVVDSGPLGTDPAGGVQAITSAPGTGRGGDIHINTGSLDVLRKGGVGVVTTGPGDAGTMNVTATDITVDLVSEDFVGGGLGSASLSPVLAGRSGDLNITTETLMTVNQGPVTTVTIGPGDSGDINVVADRIFMSGDLTTSSLAPVHGGRAGSIDVTTDTLDITVFGKIDASTLSDSASGSIRVNAGSWITVRDGGSINVSARSGFGADSGSIALEAEVIEVIDGGSVTSSTTGTGLGGKVDLTAHERMTLRAGRVTSDTFLSVNGGPGGSVSIDTALLEILDRGEISTNTFGSADAGNVMITAGQVVIDASLAPADSFTGIRSESIGTFLSGQADVSVTLDIAHPTNELIITTLTSPTGTQVKLFDAFGTTLSGSNFTNTTVDDSASQGFATGAAPYTGVFLPLEPLAALINQSAAGRWTLAVIELGRFPAGQINSWSLRIGNRVFQATDLPAPLGALDTFRSTIDVPDLGLAVTGTPGIPAGGRAGGIDIVADHVSLIGPAEVSVASRGIGDSGDITVTAAESIDLRNRPLIAASADQSNGGNITLAAGTSITLGDSQITAQAAANGGEITLNAPIHIRLADSVVTAEAGGDGGNITIDPQAVILDNSRIVANAINGDGGDITIVADAFLVSSDSHISASSQFGVSGSIQINSPDTDLAGSLARLSASLASTSTHLSRHCATMFSGRVSSFILTGQGGIPIQPGGRLPSPPPASQTAETAIHTDTTP